MFGSNASVGGELGSSGNVMSGNMLCGLRLNGNDGVVRGNIVGLDATGTVGIQNHFDGIDCYGNNSFIGGYTPAQRNILSGNLYDALYVFIGSFNTSIVGNWIGVDISGSIPIANGYQGIELAGFGSYVANNVVGASQFFGLPGEQKIK